MCKNQNLNINMKEKHANFDYLLILIMNEIPHFYQMNEQIKDNYFNQHD